MVSRRARSLRPFAAVACLAVLLIVNTDAIAQGPDTWSPTGSMGFARYLHTATLLPDGTVLVAGGGPAASLDKAEVYDPSSGGWSATGSLVEGRTGHTAALLPDGRVLVAGGANTVTYVASAEIYDPSTGNWSPTGSMATSRYGHTATLLPDGRVLVAGGDSTAAALGPPEVFLASAEVYDPATGTWSPTGSMTSGRLSHTATLLPDGRVLAAGGANAYGAAGFGAIRSADVYDPSTGIWSPTGEPRRARYDHTATLLADGRVLTVGGASDADSAEIYDPSTGTWSLTGGPTARRWVHSAARLPDGRVLVSGGLMNVPPPSLRISTASAEVYDPASGTWSSIDNMTTPRTYNTMTPLPDGRILVAGGYNDRRFLGGITFLASAEVYNPEFVTPPPPPQLSIDNVSVVEGNAGTTIAVFTVTLSAASTQVVTVDFATGDGTATAGLDYTASAGTLTFDPPGETTRTIAIVVNGDVDVEPNETFFLTLGNAINATIADIQGTGTIANDDVAPLTLSIDDVTVTEADSGRMAMRRSSHTATLMLDGRVLAAGGGSAEVYAPSTGTWSPAGSTPNARYVHTATLLTDGRVLVAGGWNYTNAFASAEVYDPSTNTWSGTGSMAHARWDHSATLLADGRVLVAGGTVVVGSVTLTLGSTEVYDPSTGTWSGTGSMATPRANHMATRLLDGRVLVMGGRNGIASAEVYDPSTGTWSPAGSMSEARFGHAATLLPNGHVLVAGGVDHNTALASAEMYDPAANTWSPTGSMTAARYWFSFAWVLLDGRVLVAGSFGSGRLASAELYDPSTGTWSATGSMSEGRGAHRTTLLLDGRVLVTGGQGISSRLASAEVYDPATGAWSLAGAVNAVFTVTLSNASAQIVTVDLATADATATAGSDYTAAARTLTFDANETTQTVAIQVNGDVDVEPDETFLVSLSNATNAIIADSQGTGTISNNDVPPVSLPPAATPVGSDVSVSLPPVGVTFDSVTQAGQTHVTMNTANPPPPAGFQLGDPPTQIDLSTTAVFAGSVQVCIDYSGFSFSNEAILRLFHFVNGTWEDITTTVDTSGDVICGVTTSLSPFAVFEPSESAATVLTLPGNITTEATSAAGAAVDFTATAVHEIDGPVAVACSASPGTTFALGATSVNCSAADAAGNTAAGSFTVTVVDTTAPTLTVPTSIKASAQNETGVVISFATSASDLVDGAVAVTCSPASGSLFPIGTTTVSCTATDSHGLTARESFTVSVARTGTNSKPKVLVVVDHNVPATSPAGATVRFWALGLDREDGLLPVECSPQSGDVFPIGRTIVTCTTTDSAGAIGTRRFAVTVTAYKPPKTKDRH